MTFSGSDLKSKYLPFANYGERKNFTTYRINLVYIKGDKLRPNGNAV